MVAMEHNSALLWEHDFFCPGARCRLLRSTTWHYLGNTIEVGPGARFRLPGSTTWHYLGCLGAQSGCPGAGLCFTLGARFKLPGSMVWLPRSTIQVAWEHDLASPREHDCAQEHDLRSTIQFVREHDLGYPRSMIRLPRSTIWHHLGSTI